MTNHDSARARRMDEARRSLKAAMVTISHAQTAALAVAATPKTIITLALVTILAACNTQPERKTA